MALKSYSSFKKKKIKKKTCRRRGIIGNGINTLLGVALLGETANAVAKI